MKIIRTIFMALVMPLVLAGTYGCHGTHEHPPTATSLTIASSTGPDGGPLFVANDKGFLSQAGLNAKLVPFASGRLALDALLGGKAPVAMVAETPLALAAFQNQNFYIIATVTESPLKLVLAKKAILNGTPSLKGKTLAVAHGTSGDYWMYSYLRAKGLDITDVKVVNLRPPDMVAALAHGDVDGFFCWEPFAYRAQKALGNKVTIISSKNTYQPKFNVVVSRDFAKSNPAALKNLLASLMKSEMFMKTNRAEAIQIVARDSGMEPEVLTRLWDNYNYEVVLNPSLLTSLQDEGRWAKANNIAPQNAVLPNYKDFILDEPLDGLNHK